MARMVVVFPDADKVCVREKRTPTPLMAYDYSPLPQLQCTWTSVIMFDSCVFPDRMNAFLLTGKRWE